MKPRISILSGHIARELLKQTKEADIARSDDKRPFIITFRHCTIKGERSGGAIVYVRNKKRYEHDPCQNDILTIRLRKGWNFVNLSRAVYRLHHAWHESRMINDLREKVYILAETKKIPDALPEIVEGHPIDYTSMSKSDCEFWLSELQKFPAN